MAEAKKQRPVKNNEQRTEHRDRNRRALPPGEIPLRIELIIFTHVGRNLFPRGERANSSQFCQPSYSPPANIME
jgi:hypothetical protein